MESLRNTAANDRRFLWIVEDPDETADPSPGRPNWNEFAITAFHHYQQFRWQGEDTSRGHHLYSRVGGAAAVGAVVTVGYGVVRSVAEIKRWRFRQLNPLIVTESTVSDAGFTFPRGHPRLGLVYVVNPRRPFHYYPVADFHVFMLKDRVARTTELLRELGASYSRVEVRQRSELVAKLVLHPDVPGLEEPASGEAKFESTGSGFAYLELTYPSARQPRFNVERHEWIAEHPELLEIVAARTTAQLNEARFEMTYDQNHGITASVAARLEAVKLDIGGKFVRQKSHRLSIHVRF